MAHRMEKVTLANMCALTDGLGNVLVLDRQKTNWQGIAFPGGHVEWGEPFTESVIREMKEETGLTILAPRLVGVKDWTTDEGRYIVMLYRAEQYTGTLQASDEGPVFWTPIATLSELPLASDIDASIALILGQQYTEQYYTQTADGDWIEKLL